MSAQPETAHYGAPPEISEAEHLCRRARTLLLDAMDTTGWLARGQMLSKADDILQDLERHLRQRGS